MAQLIFNVAGHRNRMGDLFPQQGLVTLTKSVKRLLDRVLHHIELAGDLCSWAPKRFRQAAETAREQRIRLSSRLRSDSARRQGRLCAPQMLLRRGRGGEFLEARIIPERIEHGIEPEQRGSQRARRETTVRDREEFL
jgi:hypothetical protein